MADLTNLGKKAEKKIELWLDKPDEGFCFDRLPDQQTGFFGSSNICDFTLFRAPNFYYIESKATWEDRWEFNTLKRECRDGKTQYGELLKKSKIAKVTCYVAVLYASYKRAFLFNIRDIHEMDIAGKKSLNIKKINSWKIPYVEIKTVPSRQELLDYDFKSAEDIF